MMRWLAWNHMPIRHKLVGDDHDHVRQRCCSRRAPGIFAWDYPRLRQRVDGRAGGAQAQLILDNTTAAARRSVTTALAARTRRSPLSPAYPRLRAACLLARGGSALRRLGRRWPQTAGQCPAAARPPDGYVTFAGTLQLDYSHLRRHLDGTAIRQPLSPQRYLRILTSRFRMQAQSSHGCDARHRRWAVALVALGRSCRPWFPPRSCCLARTAAEVSARGDYSLRAPQGEHDDELGALVDAFQPRCSSTSSVGTREPSCERRTG